MDRGQPMNGTVEPKAVPASRARSSVTTPKTTGTKTTKTG